MNIHLRMFIKSLSDVYRQNKRLHITQKLDTACTLCTDDVLIHVVWHTLDGLPFYC